MQNVSINSLKELQLQMPRLLEQYGNNQEFTAIALANPVIALQKAGIVLSAGAKDEIELYVRFGKEKSTEALQLRKKMEETGGKNFDPNNNESVAAIILKVRDNYSETAVAQKKTKTNITLPAKEQLLKLLNTLPVIEDEEIRDPLSELEQLHPIVPLLLQLRKMDLLYPRLANESDIKKAEAFIKKSPLTKVTFRLSRK